MLQNSNGVPPLRKRVKCAYGLGELGPAMAGSTMIFLQFVFLTNVAGLQAGLAGSVLMIGKIWDAVNDPLIGWLSDRTRSRWGRRLPWMVLGGIPFAIFFVLSWVVPDFGDSDSQWPLFAYYVGVTLVYNTFYTAITLSHSALTPEFSRDYDERSRITAWRMGASLGGSVGGLVVALAVFSIMTSADSASQYFTIAIVVGLIGLLALGLCVTGVAGTARRAEAERLIRKQDEPASTEPPMSIRKQLSLVVANRPFVIVCGIYLFSWLAMQFTAAILPIYVGEWLGLPKIQFQIVALTVQVTALVLIPLWSFVCVRWGKKPAYFVGMSFWLVAQAGMLLLPQGASAGIYVLAVLAGVGISVCYLVPNAMLPDVIELDELETGERREGIYYGFFVFLQKMALALGTFILGQVIGWAGYISSGPGDAPPVQPDSALWAIRVAIGPLPALAILLGMVCAAIYPITKSKHAEILERLAAKRDVVK